MLQPRTSYEILLRVRSSPCHSAKGASMHHHALHKAFPGPPPSTRTLRTIHRNPFPPAPAPHLLRSLCVGPATPRRSATKSRPKRLNGRLPRWHRSSMARAPNRPGVQQPGETARARCLLRGGEERASGASGGPWRNFDTLCLECHEMRRFAWSATSSMGVPVVKDLESLVMGRHGDLQPAVESLKSHRLRSLLEKDKPEGST